MARRLILDTGVLIASQAQRAALAGVVAEDDDLVIAAVTVAELRTGVELASGARRGERAALVADVLQALPVEAYTGETAKVHAQLLAHVHRTGTPRGAHDLIIAATAAATARTVLTTECKARFADLPGVDCIVV